MIQERSQMENNLLSYSNYTDTSIDQKLNNSINKITPPYIFLLFTIGICMGAVNDTLVLALGNGATFCIIYSLYRFYYGETPKLKYLTVITLCALSLQLFHQSQGQEMFYFLFFLLAGVLTLYRDEVLIWVISIILIAHSILIAALASFHLTAISGGETLFHCLLFLAFAYLCIYISSLIKKSIEREIELAEKLDKHLINTENNISYANQIASGNLDATYNFVEGDVLGKSLMEMSKSLKNADKEDKIRSWQIEGLARIAEILRLHNNNIEELSLQIIIYLVKYINASQGGMFILNDDDESRHFLELKACYAYSRKKHKEKEIEIGEGLIGQAFLEKQSIYLKQMPEDYFLISSGLGESKPKAIIIVPCKLEENVVSILEIASLHELKDFEIKFLEKVSESIASTIFSSKVNNRTSKLLQESQEMAEELRAQEEEMRQNLEELHATQEDLYRKNMEREKAELLVKASQMFMEGILNSLPTPVFVRNRKHEFVLANDAYCKHLGISKESLFDLSYDQIFGDKAEILKAEDDKIFLSKDITTRENTLQDKSGYNKSYIVSKAVFTDQKGEDFLIGIMLDISDRKRFEEALGIEKMMFESLMDNFPDRITFKDINGKFLRVNKSKARRHGFENPSLLIGKSDFDFFKQEHAQKAFNDEQEIINSGKPVIDIEERLTYPDGSVGWGLTSKLPLINADGQAIGTYGITRDISEKKKADLKLLSMNDILERIGGFMPVIFYKINKDKTIAELSGLGLKTMELKAEDLIGKPIDLVIPDSHEYMNSISEQEIIFTQEGTQWKFEHHLVQDPTNEGGLMGFGVKVEEGQAIVRGGKTGDRSQKSEES